MRKKEIEKIPYLGLKKINRKKDVKYIGVTAVKIVGNKKHLFLEVYKNKKESKMVPVVRIILTEKEFWNYFPKTEQWTRQKVEKDGGYGNYIWGEKAVTWEQMEKENVLQSTEDLERIKKFCKIKIPVYYEARWWQYIYKHEDDLANAVRIDREHRKFVRRQEALKDRMSHTAKLPEKRILEYADRIYFQKEHHLYYKKYGSWTKIACSKCGGVTDARWRDGISYESQFQKHTEEPREGKSGKCPMCGAVGTYKCQGKIKGEYSKKIHLFLGQRYKEDGAVLRYVEIEKAWTLGFIEGNDGPEMYNAAEELSGVEVARAYFESGKKVQIDYHKHDLYRNEDFWDDCNLYGLANIDIKAATIMPETYEELKNTIFRYSGLKEYDEQAQEVNPIRYLQNYQKTPKIEILAKLGLSEIVKGINEGRTGIIVDASAKRLDALLGIRRERTKKLIEEKGDARLLRVLQIEKSLDQHWTEEQVNHLRETGLDIAHIAFVLNYMTIQKLLNRIEKYAGCAYETNCGRAVANIRNTAIIYIDYLMMRERRGYDLHNTVYQQPRDLSAAHRQMVTETNREEVKKRLEETEERYENIKKRYRSLRKEYCYEDATYLIRPARSAEEIVMEGRILHHCVGGDNYLSKHNEGKSYILMMRYQKEPETPYITIEINPEQKRIVQWYGERDTKPDKEKIQSWLDNYLEKLKSGTLQEETSEMMTMTA
jgi:hypothetical protein